MQAADDPVKRRDRDNDRVRFEGVYATHYELILAYALRRTQSRDDATDVVAETFLIAWRRLDQAPDGPVVRLWLYGIARKVLANHLRGARRHERLGARLRAGVVSTDHSARPAAAISEARITIARAFGRLKVDDRDLLALVAAEGLSASEVAKVIGGTAATVRVRLHRARARFARELAAEGHEV
ncbi:sigma-70 family RNA polymerase sigma factor [Micromonospora sp. NIE79]|uniref:Sigma-70 family RNA polymerase sigma factor n=1 Tax=Micromonospora trifolii TaxID=2911208 RepID=A0ABS9N3I7_9ACTN|nr:sigma-70 family RNA polymerase sigma factor [Micromonospora trifolii]MCG5444515.1 sigma-70 family RNA polymerase sigma factor [Micromonospora trifolii]